MMLHDHLQLERKNKTFSPRFANMPSTTV